MPSVTTHFVRCLEHSGVLDAEAGVVETVGALGQVRGGDHLLLLSAKGALNNHVLLLGVQTLISHGGSIRHILVLYFP